MAEIHKKGDGKETANGDIPVVAPINMGKGIKWNANTKQYDVSIAENQPIHVNDNGDLEVRVSNLEDNLLRVIDGKLYYGTKPRAELAELFVDAVNGVDQDPLKVKGAGTQANPLRTFKYAAMLAEKGTSRHIRLKENQDHYVNHSQYFMIKSGVLSISPYGEVYTALYAKYNTNSSLTTLNLVRQGVEPRLVFTGVSLKPYSDHEDDFDRFSFGCFYTEENTHINTLGVRLVNDIGFNLSVNVRKRLGSAGGIRNVNVNPYRIFMGQGSRISLINSRVSTVGTPNIAGSVEETDESMKVYNLKQKDSRGLWHISLFYGQGQDISLQYCYMDTLESYLYGTNGWSQIYGADTTINDKGGNVITDITKRIFNTRFDKLADGVEQIIVPTTTIPTSYWKF